MARHWSEQPKRKVKHPVAETIGDQLNQVIEGCLSTRRRDVLNVLEYLQRRAIGQDLNELRTACEVALSSHLNELDSI